METQTTETMPISSPEKRRRKRVAEKASLAEAMKEKNKDARIIAYTFVLTLLVIVLVLFLSGFVYCAVALGVFIIVYVFAAFSDTDLVDVDDGVRTIVKKLHRYRLDEKTQLKGVEALFRLTRLTDTGARRANAAFIANEGLVALIQASVLYPENAEILARVLGVLSNICYYPKLVQHVASSKTMKWCLENFECHADHVLTCKYAFLLLSAVADAAEKKGAPNPSQVSRSDLVRYGAIRAVAKAMDLHASSEVAKWACLALFNMSMGCENAKKRVAKDGAIEAVTVGMRTFQENMEVQRLGIGMLGASLLPADGSEAFAENTEMAMRVGSFEAVRNAMRAYPDVSQIVSIGAMVINAGKRAGKADDDEEEDDGEEDYVTDFSPATGLRRRHSCTITQLDD